MKHAAKERAVQLRKEGKTYQEIRTLVPVSKSTLSLWLREVGLAKQQAQRITAKKRAAQRKGADAKHEQRLQRMAAVFAEAKKDVPKLSRHDLWLCGVLLYWGEGSKEKLYRGGQQIDFGNTDPAMIRLFILWLRRIMHVPDELIDLSIYIHESHRTHIDHISRFWLAIADMPHGIIKYVHYKKHRVATKRHNTREEYRGTLRIRVRKSIALQRKIQGWIYGITEALGRTK